MYRSRPGDWLAGTGEGEWDWPGAEVSHTEARESGGVIGCSLPVRPPAVCGDRLLEPGLHTELRVYFLFLQVDREQESDRERFSAFI